MNAHPRPYYYLENFQVALEWLRDRYHDLLSPEEQRFIDDFSRLPIESAALFVRMIMRQGDLFRTSKLDYREIGCPRLAAAPLIELGWIDPDPPLSFPDLFRLLRKAEINAALRLPRAARLLRKADLIPLVGETIGETRHLQAWWPDAPDTIFQVRIASLCERLRLMFFGNFRQTWSEFVLADLGIFRYESISLEPSARAFQTREQIEQFCAIYRCRELLHAQAPLDEVLAGVPPPLTASHGAAWIEARRAKLLFAIAQRYEKEHDLPQALDVYQRSNHPEARIRTVRVLEKLQRLTEAVDLLTFVQQQPATELEAQLSARILPRLNRKLTPPQSAPPAAHRRNSLPARAERHGWSNLELELPQPDPPQRV